MKKVIIDPELKGKDLFRFLVANKEQLIAQKKALPKFCDAVSYAPEYYDLKGGVSTKLDSAEEIAPDANKLHVKVVANTSMWCDSHMDVLLKDSAAKSMKERAGLIPMLKNHEYKIESEIGDVTDIYYEDLALRALGLRKPGTAQCLIFEADILKEYDEKVFNRYKAKKIRQHSIGLQYMRLGLAINDDEDTAHFELWEKYLPDVINKELCEEKGYFWVVPEYKLLENSAVLFGSNILTPTLDVKDDTDYSPLHSTNNPPSNEAKAFNLDEAIKTTKFLN